MKLLCVLLPVFSLALALPARAQEVPAEGPPSEENPPMVAPLGYSERASAPCNVKPPAFGGCDTDCQIMNGMRSAVLAGIGLIPKVGEGFSSVIGFFWGAGTGPSLNSKLDQLVRYVQDAIAESRSDILASLIANKYQNLGEGLTKLDSYIKTQTGDRGALLEILLHDCSALRIAMQDKTISPLQVVPYVSAVGNVCLTLYRSQAYDYARITGKTPSPASVTEYKKELTRSATQFSELAQNATAAAVNWRSNITQQTRYGGWPCGWTCNHHYGEVIDARCTEVGAIPGGRVQYDDICCNYPSAGGMTAIREWYTARQQQIFNDNFLGRWGRHSAALWKYITAESIDAGTKPRSVYATAVSSFMSMATLSLERSSYRDNAGELAEFTAAVVANGDSVRLLKLEITRGDQIIAVRTTTEVAGRVYTNTVGRWGRDTVWHSVDLSRRTGTFLTGWDYARTCVQTQQLLNPKDGSVSAPAIECKSGSSTAMFTAPPITIGATAPYDKDTNPDNPTYVPRIIGVSGLWSDHSLQFITPIWLYKKYE